MARKKGGFLNSFFYILMSVMALNFIVLSFGLFLLHQLGYYSMTDLKNMAYVLVGNRQYVLSKEQILEYNNLKKEKEELLKDIGRKDGSFETRNKSASALDDMVKQLEERIRALKELRVQHEVRLKDLRNNIEQLKGEYIKERKALDDWKNENTKNELSKRYETMQKTLRAMDPEIIANLFLGNMTQSDGPEENARIIRKYLTPDITAEVMAVLPEKDMRKIVPLIENKYAEMSPEAVVKAWTTPGTDDFKTPDQMAQYMRNMTVTQAFTIFTLLDAKNRAELVRLLK